MEWEQRTNINGKDIFKSAFNSMNALIVYDS